MHVPCFEILPKKYIIIYFSTNKFRTVMNIPSFVLRPKYINNVISYHVGNNMYVISYHVRDAFNRRLETLKVVWCMDHSCPFPDQYVLPFLW